MFRDRTTDRDMAVTCENAHSCVCQQIAQCASVRERNCSVLVAVPDVDGLTDCAALEAPWRFEGPKVTSDAQGSLPGSLCERGQRSLRVRGITQGFDVCRREIALSARFEPALELLPRQLLRLLTNLAVVFIAWALSGSKRSA